MLEGGDKIFTETSLIKYSEVVILVVITTSKMPIKEVRRHNNWSMVSFIVAMFIITQTNNVLSIIFNFWCCY